MLIEVASVLCGFVILLYWLSTCTFSYWKNKNVVGPKPTPFFGNFLPVAFNKEYVGVTTANIYKQYPNDKYVGIYRFITPVLLIRDPVIIKHILVKDFEFFQDRGLEYSKEKLGANLFFSDGNTWSVLRKKLSPLFTASKIRGMFHLVNDRAEELVKFVDSLVEEKEVQDVNYIAEKYTAEIIGTCAFGVNIEAYNKKFNKYLDIGRKQLTTTWRLMLDLLVPGSLMRLKIDLMSPEVVNHYNTLAKAIVQQREGKPLTRHDFMDLLIQMKNRGTVKGNKVRSDEEVDLEITESIIAAQVMVFFGAGFETSSTTITFMLYELALHQDIQCKIVKEIDEILKKHGGKLEYEGIAEMKYLDMVISETLRKYPVIDIVRKTCHNYKIPGSDLILEKGTNIIIPPLGLNYDPKYYPDPDHFDPERFSPENLKSREIFDMPFGDGPRECIASRFAMITMKTGIANFLKMFEVKLCSKTRSNIVFSPGRFTIHPHGGIWLSINKRF